MSSSENNNKDSGPSALQDLGRNHKSFRFQNKVLLEKGLFSDVQVTAGTRVWEVHTNIVCTRSGLIARGLRGGKNKMYEIQRHTEKQVGMVLEFIYAGDIETIDDFSLEDCVELSILAHQFDVPEMIEYATDTLWDKLISIHQAVSTIPGARGTTESRSAIEATLEEFDFRAQFTSAVEKAYADNKNDCGPILADFVWVARAWLLGDPVIKQLNKDYPMFGSQVFDVMNERSQSFFALEGGQPTSPSNDTDSTS